MAGLSRKAKKHARQRAAGVRLYAAAEGPHPDEVAFHHAMQADPQDMLPASAYSDWLEEHGRPGLAEVIRRHLAVEDRAERNREHQRETIRYLNEESRGQSYEARAQYFLQHGHDPDLDGIEFTPNVYDESHVPLDPLNGSHHERHIRPAQMNDFRDGNRIHATVTPDIGGMRQLSVAALSHTTPETHWFLWLPGMMSSQNAERIARQLQAEEIPVHGDRPGATDFLQEPEQPPPDLNPSLAMDSEDMFGRGGSAAPREPEGPPHQMSRAEAMKRYAQEYTHADFHRAIRANPHESVPALSYADWLEEQGKPAHARVIREHVANSERVNQRYPENTEEIGGHPTAHWEFAPAPAGWGPRSGETIQPGGTMLRTRRFADGATTFHLAQRTGEGSEGVWWGTTVHDPNEANDLAEQLMAENAVPEADSHHQRPDSETVGSDEINHNATHLSREQALRYGAYRAPAKVGAVVRGTWYKPGSMIPDLDGAFANPPQKLSAKDAYAKIRERVKARKAKRQALVVSYQRGQAMKVFAPEA